jgi:hypothetical protein
MNWNLVTTFRISILRECNFVNMSMTKEGEDLLGGLQDLRCVFQMCLLNDINIVANGR